MNGIPDNAPVILLAHQPRGASQNAEAGVDLQLSGHTHGGQIMGAHWLVQLLNEGFVSGLYDVGDMKLYVSNGTGLLTGSRSGSAARQKSLKSCYTLADWWKLSDSVFKSVEILWFVRALDGHFFVLDCHRSIRQIHVY